MDKITKLLKKLTVKERDHLEMILTQLLSGKVSSLNIKKLKGVDNLYRARVGNLRVIFQKQDRTVHILEISRVHFG